MIPKKYPAAELLGQLVTADRDLKTRGGQALAAGTQVEIIGCVGGIGGITVQTGTCPECGQSATVSHLKREDLSLVETEPEKNEILREVRRTVWRLRKALEHKRFATASDVVELRDGLLWTAEELKDAEAKLSTLEMGKV